jgi:hypothetical protein
MAVYEGFPCTYRGIRLSSWLRSMMQTSIAQFCPVTEYSVHCRGQYLSLLLSTGHRSGSLQIHVGGSTYLPETKWSTNSLILVASDEFCTGLHKYGTLKGQERKTSGKVTVSGK